jgi:SAM-dependent methyltransferase
MTENQNVPAPPSPEAAGDVDEWERAAPDWERHRERIFEGFRTASDWLVDRLDPQVGDTVLELAAGPGETGFVIAERVGATGRVISTDLAPGMVEAARRGVDERRLANVECRVMDAQHIDLSDHAVDRVVCRMGLMLVPDPQQAMREIRRVLRPGGRLAYAVMGPPDHNPWMAVSMGALMRHGRAPAGPNPFALGGVFGLSSPSSNDDILRDAGFGDVVTEQLHGTMRFESADDYWDFQTSLAGPVRAALAAMSTEEVAAVQATVAEMLVPFQSGDEFELPTMLVMAAAS